MSKSNFDDIYVAGDPRAYYATLGSLGYEIPRHSATLFGQAAGLLGDGAPAKVVDLCCSYGVNGTVLKYDVDFDEVVSHYTEPAAQNLSRDELLERDREWLADRSLESAPTVIGLDASEPAIAYALEAGLLDAGMSEDLEAGAPSASLSSELSDVDLITVSGGIGYITERTIDRILERSDQPWVAALCLRWVDFAPIVETASRHGLVAERLDDTTFRQRRFADGSERHHVLSELASMGIDPEGRETEGWHHTDFYLLRPEDAVEKAPLAEVLIPDGGVGPRAAGEDLAVTLASTGADLRQPGGTALPSV